MKTQDYTCAGCDTTVTRPLVRGQKPKWCPDCRRQWVGQMHVGTCATCGSDFRGHGSQFCSRSCAVRARPKAAATPTPALVDREAAAKARRGPLRAAYEDQDWAGLLLAIRANTTTEPTTGCWIWQRRLKDGYPQVVIAGRYLQAHRLALEAHIGAHLGSQSAHHKCAQPACVNPDHLQPITHRENVAEMLSRHAYLNRIRELEAALQLAQPGHPLLRVVQVA